MRTVKHPQLVTFQIIFKADGACFILVTYEQQPTIAPTRLKYLAGRALSYNYILSSFLIPLTLKIKVKIVENLPILSTTFLLDTTNCAQT